MKSGLEEGRGRGEVSLSKASMAFLPGRGIARATLPDYMLRIQANMQDAAFLDLTHSDSKARRNPGPGKTEATSTLPSPPFSPGTVRIVTPQTKPHPFPPISLKQGFTV